MFNKSSTKICIQGKNYVGNHSAMYKNITWYNKQL